MGSVVRTFPLSFSLDDRRAFSVPSDMVERNVERERKKKFRWEREKGDKFFHSLPFLRAARAFQEMTANPSLRRRRRDLRPSAACSRHQPEKTLGRGPFQPLHTRASSFIRSALFSRREKKRVERNRYWKTIVGHTERPAV